LRLTRASQKQQAAARELGKRALGVAFPLSASAFMRHLEQYHPIGNNT